MMKVSFGKVIDGSVTESVSEGCCIEVLLRSITWDFAAIVLGR